MKREAPVLVAVDYRGWGFVVSVRGSSDTYLVVVHRSGAMTCSCPADDFHIGHCRHRDAVADVLPDLCRATR